MLKNIFVRIFLAFGLLAPLSTYAMDSGNGGDRGVKRNREANYGEKERIVRRKKAVDSIQSSPAVSAPEQLDVDQATARDSDGYVPALQAARALLPDYRPQAPQSFAPAQEPTQEKRPRSKRKLPQTGRWKKKNNVPREKGKLWKCDQTRRDGSLCAKKFTSHQQYTDHINAHLFNLGLIPAPYECILCSHGDATKSNIYKHLRKGHPDLFDKNTEPSTLQEYAERNHIDYDYPSEQSASSGQEEENASDSGDTTESCYYETEEETEDEEEVEEELEESGVVPGYPLPGYQAPAAAPVAHSNNPPAPEQNPEEKEKEEIAIIDDSGEDSDSQLLSPRSKVRQEYDIAPHARRAYIKRKGDELWTCEKLDLHGNVCGKQYKKRADFVRHCNARTIHLDGTMDFGHICTLCHEYSAAAANNVYDHIRATHPEHRKKTALQLKEYVGMLIRRDAKDAAPAVQEPGAWACSHRGCGRRYQGRPGLDRHYTDAPHHRP